MKINPLVCKYRNMKKQNISRMYLFIYANMPMFKHFYFFVKKYLHGDVIMLPLKIIFK